MSTHEGLPVPGYRAQPQEAVDLVTKFKREEEFLLRQLDEMAKDTGPSPGGCGPKGAYDGRWLAVARTHFEQGYMALNRSVFRPARVVLPIDTITE